MRNKISKIMCKITLRLLLALCIGYGPTLYAASNDKNTPQKPKKKLVLSYPEYKSNMATPQSAIYRNNMASKPTEVAIWDCASIEKCSALVTTIACLQYWQQLNHLDNLHSILDYLERKNHYMGLVGAYHHLLARHICNKKDKNAYQYIHTRLQKALRCSWASCTCQTRIQSPKKHTEATDKDNKEYTFLQHLLDTIHVHLVHGEASGHRYLQYDDDVVAQDKALFDLLLVKLKKWQASLKKPQQSKGRDKRYLTKMHQENTVDDAQPIGLSLLKATFKAEKALQPWMTYVVANECDTDSILEEIEAQEDETFLAMHKGLFSKISAFIKQKQPKQQSTYTSIGPHSFGVRLYYWQYYSYSNEKDSFLGVDYNPGYLQKDLYVRPAYLFFKDEILAKTIPITTWSQKMYEAGELLGLSDTLKKVKPNSYNPLCDRYNVKKRRGLSISHIASILFYTNFTTLCTEFSASFRYLSHTESLDELIKRNAKWHHLAKYLREVVEIFGEEIGYDHKGQFCDKGPFYHVVSSALFGQPNVYFHGPLSTSQQLEVATLFANNKGLIVGLKQDNRALKLFNVSLLSPFPQEDERLFIGGQFSLQIASIRLYSDNITITPVMHLLAVIAKMIAGKYIEDQITPQHISLFNKLRLSAKGIPVYARQVWQDFTHRQPIVKINMRMMYRCYQLFVPGLFSQDQKHKQLLLFDKVVEIFPNVGQIIFEKIDCTGWDRLKGWKYASTIVDQSFIAGLKDMAMLISQNLTNKLEKIMLQTDACKINCVLYPLQFDKLGWDIRKENKFTISLTKEPNEVVCKGLISKIKAMIAGKALTYDELTYLDVLMFNRLAAKANDLPPHVTQRWSNFSRITDKITLNIYYMYKCYTLFVPLLFSSPVKNLLLFEKLIKTFPNVTEIVSDHTDYDGVWNKATQSRYSSAIVGTDFIKGLQDMLDQMGQYQQSKLKKIIIKTYKHTIQDHIDVYREAFELLGWDIQKESYVSYSHTHHNAQISLTKIQIDQKNKTTRKPCITKK